MSSFHDVARRVRAASGASGVSALRRVFRGVDVNGSGLLTASELESAVRSMGFEPGPGDMMVLLRRLDRDGDSAVSWREFADAVFASGEDDDGSDAGGGGGEEEKEGEDDGEVRDDDGESVGDGDAEAARLLLECARALGRRAQRLGHASTPLPREQGALERALAATLRGLAAADGAKSAVARGALLEALRREGLRGAGEEGGGSGPWGAMRGAVGADEDAKTLGVAKLARCLARALVAASRRGGDGGEGSAPASARASSAASVAPSEGRGGGGGSDGRSLPVAVAGAVSRAARGTAGVTMDDLEAELRRAGGAGSSCAPAARVFAVLERCGHRVSERDAGALEAFFACEGGGVDTLALAAALRRARSEAGGGPFDGLTPGQTALLHAASVNADVARLLDENERLRRAAGSVDAGFVAELERLRSDHETLHRRHAAATSALFSVTAGAAGEPLVDAADALSLDGVDEADLAGPAPRLDLMAGAGPAGLESVPGLTHDGVPGAHRASGRARLRLSAKLEAGMDAIRTLVDAGGDGRPPLASRGWAAGGAGQGGALRETWRSGFGPDRTARGGGATVGAGPYGDALTERAVGMALRRVAVPRTGDAGRGPGGDAASVLRRSWDAVAASASPGLYSGAGEWRWSMPAAPHREDTLMMLRGSRALAAPPLRELEAAARLEAARRVATGELPSSRLEPPAAMAARGSATGPFLVRPPDRPAAASRSAAAPRRTATGQPRRSSPPPSHSRTRALHDTGDPDPGRDIATCPAAGVAPPVSAARHDPGPGESAARRPTAVARGTSDASAEAPAPGRPRDRSSAESSPASGADRSPPRPRSDRPPLPWRADSPSSAAGASDARQRLNSSRASALTDAAGALDSPGFVASPPRYRPRPTRSAEPAGTSADGATPRASGLDEETDDALRESASLLQRTDAAKPPQEVPQFRRHARLPPAASRLRAALASTVPAHVLARTLRGALPGGPPVPYESVAAQLRLAGAGAAFPDELVRDAALEVGALERRGQGCILLDAAVLADALVDGRWTAGGGARGGAGGSGRDGSVERAEVAAALQRCRNALTALVRSRSRERATLHERMLDIRPAFAFLCARSGRACVAPGDLHAQLYRLGTLRHDPAGTPPAAYGLDDERCGDVEEGAERAAVERAAVELLFREMFGRGALQRAEAGAKGADGVTEEDWALRRRPAVNFAQFARWAAPLSPALQEVREQLKQGLRAAARRGGGLFDPELVFARLDADGSGKVDLLELKRTMGPTVLAGLTPAQLGELIQSFDADGDGEIELRELVALLFEAKPSG